jgi:hypothetical protein
MVFGTILPPRWLNRLAMWACRIRQDWGFCALEFLIVSATHAIAHLAMYDQATWDKYQLSKLTNGAVTSNRFIVEQAAASANPANYNDPEGTFSPNNNSIPALQRRGAVFFACHNSIWEQSDAPIRNFHTKRWRRS